MLQSEAKGAHFEMHFILHSRKTSPTGHFSGIFFALRVSYE
jgi:hypothetical protein